MAPRRNLALVLALFAVCASMGASARTTNFVVHAPNLPQEVADKVGQWAEYYRREKAKEWLGQEMPTWAQPCPLHVQVTDQGPSGATSFMFGPHGVTSQKMEIQGPIERLIHSVLPHEITHTVFAYYFRTPVPRWADEGGSVLSEDDLERDRHDKLVRQILNRGGQFPLRMLFSMKEYPQDREKVMCLYAQGFSVSHYLVHVSDKKTFLAFVAHGMRGDWDGACQKYFQAKNVQELEATWLKHLKDTKGMTLLQVAQMKANGQAPGTLTANVQQQQPQAVPATVVRVTAPPAQPLAPVPVVRAQAPEEGQPVQQSGSRPLFLPPSPAPGGPPAPNTWQPAQPQMVPVQLHPPVP
jgi:hypothetical protein